MRVSREVKMRRKKWRERVKERGVREDRKDRMQNGREKRVKERDTE